jgi:hypothetical protein
LLRSSGNERNKVPTMPRSSLSPLRGHGEGIVACVLAAGIAALALYEIASLWEFTTDDAYIPLRYARHLVAGQGPVWNVGEPPVEGYSSFLFMLLGAAALKAGIDPILLFKGLNVAALLSTCAGLYWMARRWTGPIAATIPAFFLTQYSGTISWTVSGLETAVYQSLGVWGIVCLLLGLGESRRPGWLFASGALCGLAALTRPEGPLVAVFAATALILPGLRTSARAEAGARLLYFAVPFVVIFVPYFLWRLGYYGALLPNAAYCKVKRSLIWTATLSFWDYAKPFFLLSLIRDPRRIDSRELFFWGLPAAYAFLLLWVEPVVAWSNRYALLPIALLQVAAMAGMATAAGLFGRRLGRARRELVLVGLCAALLWPWTAWTEQAREFVGGYSRRMATRQRIGEWLNERVAADQWVAVGDTGMIPYVARAKIIDLYCLNSSEFIRAEENRARFARWVYAKRPAAILLVSTDPTELKPTWLGSFMIAHPDFSAHYEVAEVFASRSDPLYTYFAYRRRE